MITRRTIVTTALGLVVLFGAFGSGWQLALATQGKSDQPPQDRVTAQAVPLSSPSAVQPDLAPSSWGVSPSPDQVDFSDFSVLESLEAQVRDSQAQTRRLEGQVTTLTGQLAALTETVSRLERETLKRTSRSPGQQADEASFIAAGFDPTTASTLVKQLSQFALDEMYLRDQATREGWIGTPKYREEQAALQQQNEAFRAELSEDEYDRFLYLGFYQFRLPLCPVSP